MSELRELYQEMILDHGRHPRNFGVLPHANYHKEGFNPLCGDKISLYLCEKAGVVEDVGFDGCGCAISMASASLMTEAIKGKTTQEAARLFTDFHVLVTGLPVEDMTRLGKLVVFSGVAAYPVRVKCAILAWHVLQALLKNDAATVSTE
ncbi:MAG: SUF system NifU family Fe-S cluster assembly protein [Gammaproteobacteria bacterium RIFCSPHIGHO2_12_FULL_41_20]|nr:MAG: SUF system NifU family Fe-S cluster assembly protein [Gammaproteobacteria bacterium RIFCSPHIGHO2_12_FULL_41_20]